MWINYRNALTKIGVVVQTESQWSKHLLTFSGPMASQDESMDEPYFSGCCALFY